MSDCYEIQIGDMQDTINDQENEIKQLKAEIERLRNPKNLSFDMMADAIRIDIKRQKDYMEAMMYTQSSRMDALDMAECAIVDLINWDSCDSPNSDNIADQIKFLKNRDK